MARKRKTSPVEPPVGLNDVMRGKPPSPPEIRSAEGRFLPGVSGNPGGRPGIAKEIRELAQADSVDAYRKVRAWMDSENGKISLTAALAILKVAGVPMSAEESAGVVPQPSARPYAQAPTDDLLKRASVSSTLPQ
jgi:hypothetical protein